MAGVSSLRLVEGQVGRPTHRLPDDRDAVGGGAELLRACAMSGSGGRGEIGVSSALARLSSRGRAEGEKSRPRTAGGAGRGNAPNELRRGVPSGS